MKALQFACWLIVFICLFLVFFILFQYGPSNFRRGAKELPGQMLKMVQGQ